ncbi:FxsA family protein [Endothiovibrio diazotrophicus]
MPLLFLLFVIIPFIEIYLLIKVGGVIGALPTIGLVVLTAVIGAGLLRAQGLSTLARVQQTLAQGGIPAIELMEGAFLLVGGALLLTPGFFTDALGFACLIPPLRRWMIAGLLERGVMHVQSGFGRRSPHPGGRESSHGPQTLDGEWRREDD